MIQEIFALIIVATAVFYAVHQMVKFFRSSGKSSSSRCSHCPLTDRKNCSENPL